MLSLLLHWLTQMSSFAPEGSCTCWLCKVPALITSALLSYSKNDWLPRVLPWYPHAKYTIRASIIFHSFHWFFCYQYLLCLVKYWPRDHFVNMDNLDSPRKCVSVASTLAPLRASLWWTFQHAPGMWKSGQLLWKRMFCWCWKTGASEWPFSSSLPTFYFCAEGLPNFDFQEFVLLPGHWWLRDRVKWKVPCVRMHQKYITHIDMIYTINTVHTQIYIYIVIGKCIYGMHTRTPLLHRVAPFLRQL